ncbi:type I restriction-modification system subunit M [Fibrella sp. HMF5335]|uniref:site-specific DNA-methyltransferase (adenine-specific) n=1 Tax=Fibrella rubiginis TaxID=2817060 RepID=A0A939GKR2_9BACT|nr:type I restriction-modification system subunit M [Fibrella rubiginis]MBO0938208.1 type I restriction-modification system subunit M [Fibrella rubiginis]
MSIDQKRLLEQSLWNIANALRGKMDADDFRDYILGFIFYKYLSEKMELYANELLATDEITYTALNEADADHAELLAAVKEEAVDQLGFFLKPNELFKEIVKKGQSKAEGQSDDNKSNFILGDLATILNNIEQSTMGSESEEDFNRLFEDLDLTSSKLGRTESAKNALIVKVLEHLNAIDFDLSNAESDILGDAYEYLIGQFASGAGKKAGEFYTPQQVSKILAKLVTTGKTKLRSVYDPTCGSGSLLLRVAKEVKEVSNFYGQELNRTTYNLARMNMILHDVHYRKFDIRQDDTLEHPQHIDKRFEAIVANPPFSTQWSASPLHLSDDRFSQYGRLAPASKADFAFVQHMIHHLAENGQMAVVVAHGVLFRGGAEGHIREHLIADKNYLDAVIGLPANIFYGTSIPTAILVFKKCREQPNDILFVDASAHFQKGKNQNYLRDTDIDKIIDTYRGRLVEDKYSYRATVDAVKANEYNLNIQRYVDTFAEEAAIDLDSLANQLQALDSDIATTDATIADFCRQLNISTPF